MTSRCQPYDARFALYRAIALRQPGRSRADGPGFIVFAQNKFSYSKETTEEAYKVLVDALSQDGIVDDSVLQAAIDEAKTVNSAGKTITHTDVVD